MRRSGLNFFLVSAIALVSCGCGSLCRPSNDTKFASYTRIQNLFTGDSAAAVRQTYVVLSGDSHFEAVSKVEKTHVAVTFTNSQSSSRGLAIGLAADGYLLTAGHVLNSKSYVLGWFEDRIELRPARVVFQSSFISPADFALLKVEGKLDHCIEFGDEPSVGQRVFAVAQYGNENQSSGEIKFAGGTVVGVRHGPKGSSVDLIETDIPLWRGDSGGPLLSQNGRLVGVSTRVRHWWLGHRRYRTTSFLPSVDYVQTLIAEDRALKLTSLETTE